MLARLNSLKFNKVLYYSVKNGQRNLNTTSKFFYSEKGDNILPTKKIETTEENQKNLDDVESTGPPKKNHPNPRRKTHFFFAEHDSQFEIDKNNLKAVQYTPFPLNPLFRPYTPVPEARKTQIFETYMRDTEKITVRKLAQQFKLSIQRVEAILKLKLIEKGMINQGFTLQTNFQKGMDKLLGTSNQVEFEPIVNLLPKVGKPIFRAIDEGVPFTSQDAAKALKRQPFDKAVKILLSDKKFEFHGLKKDQFSGKEAKPEIISIDENLKNKRQIQFMFADINPKIQPKDRKVWVRDPNGTLRFATIFEKEHRAKIDGWPLQNKWFNKDNTPVKF